MNRISGKARILVPVLLALLAVAALAGCSREEPAGQSAVTWAASYEKGLAQARAEGKPVMLVFYADWCHWCVKLHEEVFSDNKVGAAANALVNVRVNTDEHQDLARQYRVQYLPTVLFLKPDGSPLGPYQGERTPAAFVKALNEVAEKYGGNA